VLLLCTLLPSSAQALCTVSLLTPCLEVTWPAASLALGTVNAGTTTLSGEQTMTVSSNLDYGVKVASDLADGRMKEWTGAAYVGASPKILTSALDVAKTSYNGTTYTPAWHALTSTPFLLGTNLGPTDCLIGLFCGSRDLGVKYRLRTSFADRRASPNSYRILVTYTADHGF
jgi:hypothetical protein